MFMGYIIRATREGSREEAGDTAVPRIQARDDEIRFFTLVNTPIGYFPTSCSLYFLLARDRPAIIRLLVARAQRATRR